MNAPLLQTRFRVSGMDCASCAAKIDAAARRIPGVQEVAISVTAGTMAVHHAPDSDLAALRQRVAGLGYETFPLEPAPSRAPHGTHAADALDGACCGGHSHATAQEEATSQAPEPPTEAASEAPSEVPSEAPWWRSGKVRLTLLSGLALGLAFGFGHFVPSLEKPVFILAMLVGLVPIARRAFLSARDGLPFTIEMLMTIAALGAILIGAAEEAAAVVFLFLVGEWLEGFAAGRARASIRSLTALVPDTALLEQEGGTREVPAARLAVEDVILVRPGDRMPADGIILSGESTIDEAPVTGESTPVLKGPGATVFAGTVNADAALRVRVTAAAQDNTIARVVRLVEEAQESKAPTERFIDRFARYYTPAVVAVATLVAVIPPLLMGASWDASLYKGLAILLIGCPCALVISTPAAIAAGLSAGARRGLLMKGGAVLEGLGKVTAVCLDKTGTLTAGQPTVTDVIGLAQAPQEVLRLAAALEAGSSHPLARAILEKAEADGIAVPAASVAKVLGGKGVSAVVEGRTVFLGSPKAAGDHAPLDPDTLARIATLNDAGKTVSVLVADGTVAGAIAMRDEPRADAIQGLRALSEAGIRTMMLTGDNHRTAEAIGRQLGIEVRADLLPQDKQRIVGELKAQGLVVAKVGDGINDAPALAAADVGIAMGGGTDVALETADAAILHGRVGDVADMVALSRRTMGNIRQNITIALGLKVVFLVTTIIGLTGLWPAILADTGATVLVTMNALRLLANRPS